MFESVHKANYTEIIGGKTMDDILMNIPNNGKQNYPLCRLNLNKLIKIYPQFLSHVYDKTFGISIIFIPISSPVITSVKGKIFVCNTKIKF